MDKQLEFIPQEGTYALPYVANAAGILYNKDLFEEHGWKVPQTWSEFMALCEQIQSEGVSRYISDLKIHGPVWLHGMRWLSVWRIRSFCSEVK